MDLGPPTWHCYLRGIIMDDIYVNGMHVNKHRPVMVKGITIHRLCPGMSGRKCKKLSRYGENVLLAKANERYKRILGR